MDKYTTPIGLTSQFSFCGLPLRLDTYAGCGLSCTYCFARLRGGSALTSKIRKADSYEIIKAIKSAYSSPEKTTGIVSEFLRNKTPIHLGGMSDPFQPIEKKERITFSVLQYLCSIKYPLVISTKSPMVSENDYLEILRSNPNVVLQFSFSTCNDETSKIVEPHSFRPSEILKAIEKVSRAEIKTTIRWQPYIPYVSESPELFVQKIADVGVRHIGFEHLKLPLEKDHILWKRLLSNLKFDIKKYYKNLGAYVDGRELILPAKHKVIRALEVRSPAHKYRLSFGSADNDIQYLSDFNCCCSGVDQFIGFENWNKFQIAYAIKKSNGNEIRFDSLNEEWYPKGSIDKYLNSKSRIKAFEDHNTIKNYMEKRWDDLNSSFNPTRFHGVIFNGKVDENGFKIYNWSDEGNYLIKNNESENR
jgi:DNA repair photolyase